MIDQRPVGLLGLRALSLALGIFLSSMGLDKVAWLGDPGLLEAELRQWTSFAPAVSRWYVETLALPGVPVFARLVPLGEVSAGVALVLGYRVRLAAAVALVMILNFHVAMGVIFSAGYLTNGYGLPVVGGLAALALGGRHLPFGLGR